MRAPPDAETETSGTPLGRRALAGPHELLSDDAPHRAAHEREVHDRELALLGLDRRGTADDRVAEPRLHLRLGQALRVRPEVEEPEGIGRAEVLVLLGERARIDELLDALARANAEVVPALRAHAKRLLELVVPVVGAAAGARVRVVGALGRLVRSLALDLDVDATLAGRHALESSAGLEAGRGEHPCSESSVAVRREEAGDAHPRDRRAARDVAEELLRSRRRRARRARG